MVALIITALFFCFSVFAQTTYNLTGSYPNPESIKPVEYKINFSQKSGRISGTYQDDSFGKEIKINGIAGGNTRIIRVPLPNQKTISALTIVTADSNADDKGQIMPVSIVIQNMQGMPLATSLGKASLAVQASANVAQQQQEKPCQEGFGTLAGYCGRYEGMVTEETDPNNLCRLGERTPPSLELNNQGTILLHVGPVSKIVETPMHQIGRIKENPENNVVEVMSRECRPLAQTNFPGDDCKQLNLRASFTNKNNIQYVTGTYTILDEETHRKCSYSFSMNRVQGS